MKRTDAMKEMMIVKKLKAEDAVELPMDEMFFDDLHNKIMMSVEKTEIKPATKWEKTWVFLEPKARNQLARIKKGIKLGLVATTLSVSVTLLNLSLNLYRQVGYTQNNLNKSTILNEAQKNPLEWSEMVVTYQNENDFYADILSQKDSETIVEIDKMMSQSL